jgi:23S rRNA (guanosine2251-2'-O)-methyltransferase
MTPKTMKNRDMHPKRGQKHQKQGRASPQPGGKRQPAAAAPRPPKNGIFIWGRHAVAAALANSERRVAAIYATAEAAAQLEAVIKDLSPARQSELPSIQITDRRRLDGVNDSLISNDAAGHDTAGVSGSGGDKPVHQGMVIAVWPLEAPRLDDFLATIGDKPVRILMLDQLSDPRNVGAIMRSARAFGVAAIITTQRHAPEESGSLARTATGALEDIPLIRVVNLSRAIEALQAAFIPVAGLAGEGDMDVAALANYDRLAIIMGAEGAGLRRLTRDHCDYLVRIPIADSAESLNVSNAAAIALYAAGAPTTN